MLTELIEKAKTALGSYGKVAEGCEVRPSIVSEWKSGIRKPTAYQICYMAEIAGLNPLDTLAEIQAELDKEKANYWNKWRARRDSNPRPLPSR